MDEQLLKIEKNRKIIEEICLGAFLKNLTSFREYKVSVDDFIYEKTVFYFSLGRAMSEKYTELDENTVLSFVKNNDDTLMEYNRFGGWEYIKEIMELANVNNTDAYIDNLAKNNLLMNLRYKGFNVADDIIIDGRKINLLELFNDYTAKDIEVFYEGLLSRCSVESISQQVKIENLIITDEIKEKLKEHENAGVPFDIMFSYSESELGISDDDSRKDIYSLPLLSGAVNGLHNGSGNTMILAHSGQGKSTITFFNFLLPMIYRGETCLIISNEQSVEYFRTMLYSFISANVFKNYNLTRKKITNGDFTKEEEDLISKISDFLINRGFRENLKFITMEQFSVDEIMRISKPLIAHEGVSTILIDTMKAEDSSSSNYVGVMTEAVKKLDSFGNKYQVKIIMTQQLQSGTEMQNAYLTASEISECKAVKTVSDILLLMRTVVNDLELDERNKDFFLKPYKRKKGMDGKWRKQYINFTEDEIKNNKYRLIFVNKNRHGETGDVLLVKFDSFIGKFTEVGLCSYVSRKSFSQGRRY